MELSVFLNALTAFFVIIDPIGSALIFHSLVPEKETRHRYVMAVKATVISALLLIVFGLYGEPFLKQLGIDINALRIAGGLLLFYTAFNMITEDVNYSEASEIRDISVFPMSIPLLAGPGALTLSILLFSADTGTVSNVSVIAALLIICLLTLVLLVLSKHLKKLIRQTGDEIIRRFLGVILAALAVQFVYDGCVNISTMI